MSILPEKLSKFSYYVNKLPLYLKNSESFKEHFRIWFDFLVGNNSSNGVKGASDTLLSLVNVFSDDYLNIINTLDGQGSDILDKLGSIFNVQRNFSVIVSGNSVSLSLDNKDFLLLIKAQIIRNYCNGSYKQMKEFYEKSNLNIFFKTTISGNTQVYLLQLDSGDAEQYSQNVINMFLAGLLTIPSMGIGYSYLDTDYNRILFWNKEPVSGVYSGWGGVGDTHEGEWIL